ncbi:MAG: hypothetical protein DRJ63_08525 [Thermoprotei archaeon]|nr:MAG: hypothetical protein DRJ63_08525 [Thermoprotei archaeon]
MEAPSWRNYVTQGSFFLFINLEEESCPLKTIKIEYEEDGTRKTVELSKGIVSLVNRSIKVESEEVYGVTLPKLDLTLATSDRKVYQKGDSAKILVWAPLKASSRLEVFVYRNDQLEYEDEVFLDSYGTAVYTVPDLELGEYRVVVGEAEASFTVAEYTLPILRAVLEDYKIEEDILKYKIKLLKLGEPYEGPLKIGLYCDYCREVVREEEEKAVKGELSGEISLKGHTGAFSLYLTTPTGETANIDIPLSKISEREPLVVKALGKVYEIHAAPTSGAVKARGLYIKQVGVETSPLEVSDITSKPVIKILSPLDIVLVVVYDLLSGKKEEHYYTDLKPGQVFKVDTSSPYTILLVGAMNKKKFYEYATPIILQSKPKLSIELPSKIESSRLKLVLHSPEKIKCILLIEDVRTQHESLEEKLASKTMRVLRESMIEFTRAIPPSLAVFLERRLPEVLAMETYSESRIMYRLVSQRGIVTSMQPLAFALPAKGAAGGKALEVAVTLERQLILLEELEVEGTVVREIELPDVDGVYRVKVYGFYDLGLEELEKTVEVSKPLALEIDAPTYISEGDLAEASIYYRCLGRGVLRVEYAGKVVTEKIEGSGRILLVLTKPTTIKAYLESDRRAVGAVKEILQPGLEKVTASRLVFLEEGAVIEAPRILVYGSVYPLVKEIAESLIVYPFGCAEQTSAKLAGLAVIYKAIKSSLLDEDLERVEKLIKRGIARMKLFYKDGLFSLWEEGEPSLEVTVKVLKNLKFVYKQGFPEIDKMIEEARSVLLELNYRNNELLFLGKEFYEDKIKCIEDAVNVYFYMEDKREKALKYIKENAVIEDSYAYWRSVKAWAGPVETTCEALKVLYHAGEKELFKKGFNYISGKLVNNRLYSTADTRALIDLLTSIKLSGKCTVEYNGLQVDVYRTAVFHNKIKVVKGTCIAKIDEEKWINLLTPTPNYDFQVLVDKTQLKLGEKTKIVVKLNEQTIAPLTKIWLPPGLVYPKGGVNIQIVYKPVTNNILEIEAVAVRKSRGQLKVLVHDMYDSSKIGTTSPIEITVGD